MSKASNKAAEKVADNKAAAAKKAADQAAAAKKAADLKAPDRPFVGPDTNPTGRSTEKAGIGREYHPANLRVPESVLIKREPVTEQGTKIETSQSVQGNQSLMVMDVVNNHSVHLSLIEGVGLIPEVDGRLIYVERPGGHNDLSTIETAKGKFAVKKDGTVIYNERGIGPVPADADFDLIDIVALIEHNHSSAGITADKKLKADAEAADKKQSAEEKKAADKKKSDERTHQPR